MAAKHIVIAKTDGVEAGFDAFMSAPSSKLSPNYAEIMKKRTPHTRLQAYCNIFGEKIGKVRPNKVTLSNTDEDVQGVIEALNKRVNALLAQLNGGTSEQDDTTDDSEDVPVLSTSTEFITGHVAWVLLGSDPDKRPGQKNPERLALPATSGQMYALNANGFLSAVTEALNAQAEATL